MNVIALVLALAGTAAVVYGVAMLSVPAAWITGGVLVLALAYLSTDVPDNEADE